MPPTDAELSASLHFAPGVLVVTDPEHRALTDRSRWSPSSAQSFGQCPSRWAMSRLVHIPDTPFGVAPLGTATHRVFEILYGLPAAQRTAEQIEAIIATLHTDPGVTAPSDEALLEQWRAEVRVRCAGGMAFDPANVVVLSLERSLDTARIGDVPFIGRIDRTELVINEAGIPCGTRVVDDKSALSGCKPQYKRERYGDAHGDQVRMYAHALADLDGRYPEALRITYTATGEAYDPSMNPTDMARVKNLFVDTFHASKEAASTGRFPTKASPLCGWCPLATVCPSAAEAGLSTPKVEEAMTGSRIGIRSLGDTPIYPPLPEPARIGTPEPDTKENTMPQPILVEDKTWEETSPDNRLNGNSYAAIGAFGLTTMAVEELHRHGQPITRATVRALSSTFAAIVREVQTEMSGQSSMQHGTNSRMRGALRATVDTLPVPFGADEAGWAAWQARTVKRVSAIAAAAVDLWCSLDDLPAEPWAPLVAQPAANRPAA